MRQRTIPLRDLFLLNTNVIIRFLIISDIVAFGSAGLLGPIFAIFITDFIQGGSVEVAGVAAAIFLLSKSVLQIPAAYIVDKICGDRDDYWFLVIGMVVVQTLPLLYLVIDTPLQLYLTQFVLGVATAATFPSFMALFTRNIPPGREGVLWGAYFTLTDIAQAAAAAIGGVLAATIGFEKLIYLVVGLGVLGILLYIPIAPGLRDRAC